MFSRAALAVAMSLLASCRGSGEPSGAAGPALLPARAPTAEELASAVAVVDGEPISAADVKRQAEAAGGGARAALDALIDAKLLVREAERRGLAADPDTREAQKREMVRRYLAATFERDITPANAVTDDDIRRAYEKNANQFDHPEIRVVLHILAPATPADPPAVREAALRRAEEVAARAREAHDEAAFKAIATALSDEKVKLKGEEVATGAVGWTVRPFADAAFALQTAGAVSGVVETRFGFHVLWLKEKIPAVHVPIETVKDKLREGVYPEMRRRAFGRTVDELVDRHHVEAFPGRLSPEGDGHEGEAGEPGKPEAAAP